MIAIAAKHQSPPSNVSVVALFATGAVQVTAALMANAMPAIVSALTSLGKLDPKMAGYVIGVDLGAQVGGTLLFLKYGQRSSWSTSMFVGMGLMVAGNLLSCLSQSTGELFGTRLVAGVGAGVVRSACFVAFARARDPARAIAGLNVAQIITTAAAFATFPWLTRVVGWYGPYLALSGLGVLVFATAWWWPILGRSEDTVGMAFSFGRTGAVCLVAVFIYFLAQSAVWGFAEALGASVGQSSTHVTSALEVAAFAGIPAAGFVFLVSTRLSGAQSFAVGLCLTLAGLYLLTLHAGLWPFVIGLGLFNFSWAATSSFEFSTAAAADGRGNTAAAFSAADALGLAAGPAIGGTMIAAHRPMTLVVVAAICTLISILLFVSISPRRSRSM